MIIGDHSKHKHRLKQLLGTDGYLDADDERAANLLKDYRGAFEGKTPFILVPANQKQLQAIMTMACIEGWALVPQGGNTGLVGGSVPHPDHPALLVSLRRMNTICSLNKENATITVEAGVTLEAIQKAAQDEKLCFPVKLAALHATAGGLVATNAGGQHVFCYGMVREQVMGLEVVLPDGSLWKGGSPLLKDNSGYDLKQLFIGSEGTLGIISTVTFRLLRHDIDHEIAFIALDSRKYLMRILYHAQERMGSLLSLFEYINDRAMALSVQQQDDVSHPFCGHHSVYGMLAFTFPAIMGDGGGKLIDEFLAELIDKGWVIDAVRAADSQAKSNFHRIRDGISDAQKRAGFISLKHDISLPLDALCDFLHEADAWVKKTAPSSHLVTFGHCADGSLHYNIQWHEGEDSAAAQNRISDGLYDMVCRFGGSISGEHGIGRWKRGLLTKYKDEGSLALMRQLKQMLDPDGRMNPAVIFADDAQ